MNVKEYIKSWAESYKKDLTENIMPFWMKYGLDRENGGVYTCVDRDGSLMTQQSLCGSRAVSPSSARSLIIM